MTEISRLQATQPLNNQPITPEQPEPKVSFKGAPDSFEKSSSTTSGTGLAVSGGAGALAGGFGAEKLVKAYFKRSVDKNVNGQFDFFKKLLTEDITDDNVKNLFEKLEKVNEKLNPESLAELAEKFNMPTEKLEETVDVLDETVKAYKSGDPEVLKNLKTKLQALKSEMIESIADKIKTTPEIVEKLGLNAEDLKNTEAKQFVTSVLDKAKEFTKPYIDKTKELCANSFKLSLKSKLAAAGVAGLSMAGLYAIGSTILKGGKKANAESLTPQE